VNSRLCPSDLMERDDGTCVAALYFWCIVIYGTMFSVIVKLVIRYVDIVRM
jgi:hypothetical protein